jgi:paraquat-inducible protein B
MLFSPKRAEIVWQDEAPLWYEGIKIGKIENVQWDKQTGEVEITFKVFKKNINKIKKLIGINK